MKLSHLRAPKYSRSSSIAPFRSPFSLQPPAVGSPSSPPPMLSSRCENMMAYAMAGRRAAVLVDSRRPYHRPNVEVAPSCPRCDSPNTKFCYYNNYSLSQPRYFCKGCRRYWTKGGSLRNVPVGGGCRKNRRSKAARLPAVDGAVVAAAASAGRDAAFSHRFHGPVRPDLLLEGMVGNGDPAAADLCRPASPAGKPAAADGSTIDLALLYAKFLNQQPDLVDQCAAVVAPELVGSLSGGSSDMSRHGLGELCEAPASTTEHCAIVDATGARPLGFSVDQSCYDSLGLPADGGHLILPPAWDEEAKYEPFDSLPEDDVMSLGHDGGGDDVWSNALGCQGLEAALCRPQLT